MAPVLIGDEELTIGDEELTVEEVERLGARRLAEIVVKHCYRDEGIAPNGAYRVGGFGSG